MSTLRVASNPLRWEEMMVAFFTVGSYLSSSSRLDSTDQSSCTLALTVMRLVRVVMGAGDLLSVLRRAKVIKYF